jgi:hypothetical protein
MMEVIVARQLMASLVNASSIGRSGNLKEAEERGPIPIRTLHNSTRTSENLGKDFPSSRKVLGNWY